MPVTGQYHGRTLVSAAIEWQGMKITTDGDEYINMPLKGGLCGDMSIANWQALKALAQTDIMERLIVMARRYATAQGGWVCEGCGGRPLPDDEDQHCGACRERRWEERYGKLRGARAFRASFQQVAA